MKYSGLLTFLEGEEYLVTFYHWLGEVSLVVRGGASSFYLKLQILFSNLWVRSRILFGAWRNHLGSQLSRQKRCKRGWERELFLLNCYIPNNDTKGKFENIGRNHL